MHIHKLADTEECRSSQITHVEQPEGLTIKHLAGNIGFCDPTAW